ncbi:MAG: FUSC family membrane protein [Bacteroidota bacterium]
MLNRPIRSIQDFLLSTYFADGLRITFGVLCPSLILAQYGMLQLGMTLSLGALCASVVDSPGPIVHRRNAMLVTTSLITVISVVVGLANTNPYFIAIILILSSFGFSMLFVYGLRAASIGTAALLVMVLSIDDIRPWNEVLLYSALICGGSIWYTILSYLFYRLRPFRLAQQTLSDSIFEISAFLRAKAKFYHQDADYEKNYAELLQLQVLVHEKQDAVREILFRTREILRETTPEGRFLMLVFVDTVDLFEQIMSTFYNYYQLHDQFDDSGILTEYEVIINKIAHELDEIAFALKTGGTPSLSGSLQNEVFRLKQKVLTLERDDQIGKYTTLGIIALKNIEINIENILSSIKAINGYFNEEEKKNLKPRKIDVGRFITPQRLDANEFFENLSFNSSVFRHALRVAIVMFIGYVVSKMLTFSHSYWILLTILVISKPGFSLTKQRNFERLIGTVIGALIGMGILIHIQDKHFLFVILLICMIGCYSFQRKNYVVSVLFMTPYILVLFDFLGMGGMSVARERIYDTFIGSGIALIASYSLFPSWEYKNLREGMIEILRANLIYFEQVTLFYTSEIVDLTNYKVARKEVYVATANLASLFQRMFSEPKSKQIMIKELHQFTALNHQLSSYIATLSLYSKDHSFKLSNFDDLKPIVQNTSYLLSLASDNLTRTTKILSNVPLVKIKLSSDEQPAGELEISQQFELIQKVSYDIFKLSEKFEL